jgi:hypothetical protein
MERNLSAARCERVPRYFFRFRDGGELDDQYGIELADEVAAREEAILGARSIMSDCVKKGRLGLSATISATDESGKSLFVLPFKDAVQIE